MDKRLRISELQQNLLTEYDENMKKSLSQHHRLDVDKFMEIDSLHQDSILGTFVHDQETDIVSLQILKQQLALKSIQHQNENDEKPTLTAITSGAVVGTATGITVATGGAVGATIVTSSLAVSAAIATGGLVLVGVTAVAMGVGVGIGVRKLVGKLQRNEKYERKNDENEKKKLI